MNRPLEFAGKAFGGFAADKARRELAQMFGHRPEPFLGQDRVAHFVGVREIVTCRRGRAPNGRQGAGVELQRVADIVEPDAMGHRCVAKTDDVAPLIEGASLLIVARLPSQLGHPVVGNIGAKLTDKAEFARGSKSLVFHLPAVWQVC